MLCSTEAGCRQLSELTLFSSLPSRVDTPKGSANRQDSVCPVCCGNINVLLRWPEGRSFFSGVTAFSSSVPSPVLCLPPGLALPSSWKDLRWQPCVLWAMCSITHLAVGLTLLQKGGEYGAVLQLLSAGPTGWPWGASPEKLVSEGTAFCSRRTWCGGFLSVPVPDLEGAQPALLWLRELSVPLHCFCFCEVLPEFFFASCSFILSVFFNHWFPAVSPGLFASDCPAGCSQSRAR